MSSQDRGQITHVIAVLRGLLACTDPVAVIRSVATALRTVTQPPPGDPARLRDLAAAFRTLGDGVAPIAGDVRVLGAERLPAVWGSAAGDSAAVVLGSAADLLDAVQPAFTTPADAIDGYAGVAVAVICWWVAGKIVDWDRRQRGLSKA